MKDPLILGTVIVLSLVLSLGVGALLLSTILALIDRRAKSSPPDASSIAS